MSRIATIVVLPLTTGETMNKVFDCFLAFFCVAVASALAWMIVSMLAFQDYNVLTVGILVVAFIGTILTFREVFGKRRE